MERLEQSEERHEGPNSVKYSSPLSQDRKQSIHQTGTEKEDLWRASWECDSQFSIFSC